jgi:hypothetical protein
VSAIVEADGASSRKSSRRFRTERTIKLADPGGWVHPTYFNLGAMGIHGNGHMMMLEKNSDQIAEVMEQWVRKSIAE